MQTEELLQIRRRIIYLAYSNTDTNERYISLIKEQESLRALLIDRADLLKRKGIKPEYFGHLIMKSDNNYQKELYLEILRNEMKSAIEEIIYK